MADDRPETIIALSEASSGFQTLELPLDGSRAGMALMFREYDYQSTDGIVTGGANASMLLPLASNLIDSYSINIGQNEIGGMGALAAQVASGNGGDALGVIDQATGMLEEFGAGLAQGLSSGNFESLVNSLSTARGYSAFMGRNLLDSLPGGSDISAGIDVGTGTAINPHAALQFKGVNLKTHQFQWKLSPKNRQEADTIRSMALRIKQAALPSYNDSGSGALSRALLRYPDLVDIWFVGVEQSYFYYFKPCMINNFSVNYAPDGVVLNRGGIPNSVIFDMQVTEARIHTRDDAR